MCQQPACCWVPGWVDPNIRGCLVSRDDFSICSWFSCLSNVSCLTWCPWSAVTLLEQICCYVKDTTGVWNVIFVLYWGMWFNGCIGDRLIVGPGDLCCLFQPLWFCDLNTETMEHFKSIFFPDRFPHLLSVSQFQAFQFQTTRAECIFLCEVIFFKTSKYLIPFSFLKKEIVQKLVLLNFLFKKKSF